MNDYKELIVRMVMVMELEDECSQKELADIFEKSVDAIRQLSIKCRQLEKERNAAIADLEKCMYYATPKNNNVCNFCKKDMSEYPNKCDGWSDFCECEPKWRGVQDECRADLGARE